MTGAEFNDRFQLVRQVTDGRVRTFHAVASTGAVVMVHIVDAGAAEESLVLADLLGRLDPEEKPRILDVTEVDGSPVIITKFILEFTSLREWLEAHAVDAAGPRSPAVAPPQPPAEPGQSQPEPAVPTPEPSAESKRPPQPISPAPEPPLIEEREAPAQADADESGEFTRLFRAASPPPAEPPSPAPAPPAPPSREPGEFTREFLAGSAARAEPGPAPAPPPEPPASASPPPAAEDAAAADEPGEFTRMFRAATPPPTEPPRQQPTASRPRAPEPPPPTPQAEPGFTDAFRSPLQGSGTSEPARPKEREGEFTRMLRAASGLTPGQAPPPASPQQPQGSPPQQPPRPPQSTHAAPPPAPPPLQPTAPPPTPKPTEPGEFTRWFAKQTGPDPSAASSSGLEFGAGPGQGGPGLSGGSGSADWLSRLSTPGGGSSGMSPQPPLPGRAPQGPWSPPPAAPPRAGPGEYTRIFSAPPPAPPTVLPPPPPQPVKGPSRKMLLWGLAGILVLALVLILVFVLLSRTGGDTPPAGAPADSAVVSAPEATG